MEERTYMEVERGERTHREEGKLTSSQHDVEEFKHKKSHPHAKDKVQVIPNQVPDLVSTTNGVDGRVRLQVVGRLQNTRSSYVVVLLKIIT